MFVDRRVFRVKAGKLEEVLSALKAEQQRIRPAFGYTHAIRNYVNLVAAFDTLIIESEWESFAEWEKFWTEWPTTPEATLFFEQWETLIETGGSHELWQLID